MTRTRLEMLRGLERAARNEEQRIAEKNRREGPTGPPPPGFPDLTPWPWYGWVLWTLAWFGYVPLLWWLAL